MSTHAATISSATVSASAPASSLSGSANKALTLGIIGLVATAAGLAVSGGKAVAFSYLTGIVFWTGIALGALFLVMIHHVFDAGWSTVLRRQFENWLSCMPWLALLFVPLIISAFVAPGMIWKWTDPSYDLAQVGGHGTVAQDVLWVKKSGLLSTTSLVIATFIGFAGWSLLANRFRTHSFTQDTDGDIAHTHASRFWTAVGLPFTALSMTLCVILWVKALDYHWYSTMYGVWFFAGCVRGALSVGMIITVWLWNRGDYKGILNNNHMHSHGMLMFAFTVFWAYITFSQYFLIYMANIPEETFWYSLREINTDGQFNTWGYVGFFLLFGHFVAPFLTLIHYPVKLSKTWMPRIAAFIAFVFLVDVIYNVMPSLKKITGDAYPFTSINLLWIATSVVGVGGVCVWAYLNSFAKTKLIPIRDPRIGESLTHHE
ncbi:hypothetical protein IMCC26134_02235 [Verrucomicrobia bacterium IMCC26134]|nr:hypothetical protein IMCC26134_02235 [Verrucomicrobia bacterium IMCC26134]